MKKCFTFLVLILAVLGLNGTMWGQTGLPSSGTWETTTVSQDETVALTGDVSLNGTITVSGCTLRIVSGEAARSITNIKKNLAGMFVLTDGGKLEIVGTAAAGITIDGGAIFTSKYATTDQGIEYLDKLTEGTGTWDLYAAAISLNGANSVLNMDYVTIQNVDETQSKGGAIYVNAMATVTANHCTIDKCRANQGAAVYATDLADGSITLTDTEISNCYNSQATNTDVYGGAVRGDVLGKANLALTNVHLHHCRTASAGGAAISWASIGQNSNTGAQAQLTLSGCELNNNRAGAKGGAIDALGNFEIANGAGSDTTKVHHNYAANGGGIAFRLYTQTVTGTPTVAVDFQANDKLKVYGNYASAAGGGMYFEANNVDKVGAGSTFNYTVDGSEIYENTSANQGGGIYLNQANNKAIYTIDFNLGSGNIHHNTTTSSRDSQGGGIYITSVGKVNINPANSKQLTVADNISATNGGGIYIAGGTIETLNRLNVTGNKGTNGGGIFINGGTVTAASDITVSNNEATTAEGGGIYTKSALPVAGLSVTGNIAKTNGGGIRINGATATLSGSDITVSNNTAKGNYGGGIYGSGVIDVNGLTVNNNTATTSHGGGINTSAELKGSSFTVSGNKTLNGAGGGIYTSAAINVSGLTVTDNSATTNGGGIYISATTASEWINVKINGNTAKLGGGVFIHNTGAVAISGENSTIDGNTATSNGGGIYLNTNAYKDRLTFADGVSISNNTATTNGGGIFKTSDDAYTWTNVKIISNTAKNGAGIYLNNGGAVTLGENVILSRNIASADGGGFYVKNGSLVLDGGTIGGTSFDAANQAVQGGGGYVHQSKTFTLTSGLVAYNKASKNGGGIYAFRSKAIINGGKVTYNVAQNDGGGVYVFGDRTSYTYEGVTYYDNHGEFTMTEGEVLSNNAVNGAGVFVDGPNTLAIKGGTISDNTATENGGGIYFTTHAASRTLTMSTGIITISNNRAKNGGGICVYKKNGQTPTLNITTVLEANITGNTATQNGGGIALFGSNSDVRLTCTASGSAVIKLQKNTAGLNGGGIYADKARVTLNNGCVIGDKYSAETPVNYGNANQAANGGGIFEKDGVTALVLYEGTVIGNKATRNGGGIYLANTAANIKYNSSYVGDKRISSNTAGGNGGGIYFNGKGKTMNLGSDNKADVFVDNNVATGNGGGIYLENGTVNFYTGEINANAAGNYGGGLFVADPATLCASYTVAVNENHVPAQGNGGGIYLEGIFKVNNANQNSKINVSTNYAGNSFSDETINNVYLYLPCENTPNKSVILAMNEGGLANNGTSRDSHIGISQSFINVPVIYSSSNNANFKTYFVKNTTQNPFFLDQGSYTRSSEGNYLYVTKEGATTWTEAVTAAPAGFDPNGIDSPEDLAWFISYVNGLNGSEAHLSANAKLTADVNMNENFWVPIGKADLGTEDYQYIGTFDGNGHTISGLEITKASTADAEYGMFRHLKGTVKNLTVNQSYFSSGTNNTNVYKIGTIAAVMEGGTISNCEVLSFLNTKSKKDGIALGGFVGQVTGASAIENSTSSSRLQTYLGGGFVGRASASLVVDNVISNVDICDFQNVKADATADFGGIVGHTDAGSDVTISNSASYAQLTRGAYAGGFVGYALGRIEIYNGVAMPVIDRGGATSSNYGGFVGYMKETNSTVKNCLAVPYFVALSGGYHGGIVGYNNGTVENCYSRYVNGTSAGNYGEIVGNNIPAEGIHNCYIDNGRTKYISTGNNPKNSGKYTVTQGTPYLYMQHDNAVTMNSETKPLMDWLNEWVKRQNDGKSATYAKWARPTTDRINLDYPVLLRSDHDYNAVASDSANLVYGTINGLLREFAEDPTYQIFLYESAENITEGTTEGGAELFIGENVGLTQSGVKELKAHVGITLDNSAGINGAGDDVIDWHFFSTSLKDAHVGIDYEGDDSTYLVSATLPKYRFTADGYFPTHIFGKDPDKEESNYYNDWDFYSYYEPEYQWVNFKRNNNSHFNENTGEHFDYASDYQQNLVPGMGYMVALKEEAYLQSAGTLNNGVVSISLTWDGDYATGYNMLGNPYQSYLDFNAFADANSTIWGGDATRASYIIMDEDQKGYIMYGYGASVNDYTAPQYLHPHQGFMVITKTACNATFSNTMRSAKSNGSTFRGSERPAYPLVNLLAYDENGNRDLTTIEVGRSDKGGAPKFLDMSTSTGLIYARYEDENYGIAYVEPGVNSIPVRFETTKDASYTMKWDVENGTFSYLHLIDNLTGVDVDCLKSDEYHFTSKTSDYTSRFKLVFESTGVEENGSDVESEETFAFFTDGNLVVNGEGNLEVIDINGRVVSATGVYGSQNVIAMPNVATGLYMLRLSSDKGVKVQKILVK